MSKEIHILLIQFRDDDMRAHEHACILEHGKLKEEHVTSLDALSEEIDPKEANEYDAILLGGSGSYCVSDGSVKSLPRIYELCREARRAKTPTLGICFGAHALTEAFGGTIENRADKQETGSFEVLLRQEAEKDPLFSDIPQRYWAQMGHKDFISELPPGAIHLGSSERATYQAWRFPDEPMYAIQFHPELNIEGLTTRIMYYLNQYIGDDAAALQAVLDNAQPSDNATRVLTNFINLAHQHRALKVKAAATY